MPEHVDGQQLGRWLVDWFRVNKRALPWRVDRNPYRVWVAEVMLQQTWVDTVAPRYESFLRRFPTVHDLAAADEDEVLKEWEGLGYYSRARHLRLAAREIVERYGGRFPEHPDELRRLPGIGPYTAAAIASIAFGRPAAAVDGNVLRVVARLYGIEDPITQTAVKRRIEQLTAAMIPEGEAADFTEAIMELGALICTPGEPDCLRCPWLDVCVARQKGVAAQLPNKPKRRPPRIVYGAVAVATWTLEPGAVDAAGAEDVNGGAGVGRVLVVRRPTDGLLAGLWEFPWVEVERDTDDGAAAEKAAQWLRDTFGVNVRWTGRLPDVGHVFSHLEWRLRVFAFDVADGWPNAEPASRSGNVADGEQLTRSTNKVDADELTYMWTEPAKLSDLAFGRAHRRIADTWLAGQMQAG